MDDDRNATSTESKDNVEAITRDDLVFTLPASQAQRQIGERLFTDGEPVVTVVGPPGKPKRPWERKKVSSIPSTHCHVPISLDSQYRDRKDAY